MVDAVLVESLVKRFGSVNAVDGVSFNVRRGEIFGILGPNGAGKTTTLEIIEGLQSPTQGSVTVLGMDIRRQGVQIKARIGVQLQSAAYFDYLSLNEILALLGSFYPKSVRPSELLEQVDLADQAKMRLNQLSGGQKQRFTIAASLVNFPELVILDEPTTGLDPLARRNIWGLIRQIHQRDVTIVMTTHYMEEAQNLCQRLAIMDQGRLVTVDTPPNLISQLGAAYSVKVVLANPLTKSQIAAFDGGVEVVQGHVQDKNTYLLRLKGDSKALGPVLEQIGKNGSGLEHMEITPVTLEDVFLELTGKELLD
ncbi:MAG: hypothetical protein BZY88_15155 [SAR202 cluster bacterium Io17-Chloro-G9]|nr:MAG: hypothetical protein BZY88_15155 [SAR202 cluster bacterium Io17-Chloro-G9]